MISRRKLYYRLMDRHVKEANIAFEKSFVADLIGQHGLTLEKTLYGYWPGRPRHEAFDFQDTLILVKA